MPAPDAFPHRTGSTLPGITYLNIKQLETVEIIIDYLNNLGAMVSLPVAGVHVEVEPGPMKPGHPGGGVAGKKVLGQVLGEVPYTLLGEDPHVDLQAEQGKDGQREDGQNDHIPEVFHRFDDGTDDCFETCKKMSIVTRSITYKESGYKGGP